MSKKKKLGITLLVCLGLSGGVLGGMLLLKKDWPDRKGELVEAISKRFEASGAPTKEVADKAAACVADFMVAVADKEQCPAEGDDVLKAMGKCIEASQELQIRLMLEAPGCIQKSLE
jgi:hypothetical protein